MQYTNDGDPAQGGKKKYESKNYKMNQEPRVMGSSMNGKLNGKYGVGDLSRPSFVKIEKEIKSHCAVHQLRKPSTGKVPLRTMTCQTLWRSERQKILIFSYRELDIWYDTELYMRNLMPRARNYK